MYSNGHQSLRSTPLDWMRAFMWLLARIVLYVGSAVGLVYALGRLRVLIIYTVIGIILAYIMRPMADWTVAHHVLVPTRAKRHVQRAIATLYVLALLFVGGYFGIKFVLSPFVSQVKEVGQDWNVKYKPQLERYTASIKGWYMSSVSQDWRDKIDKTFHQATG